LSSKRVKLPKSATDLTENDLFVNIKHRILHGSEWGAASERAEMGENFKNVVILNNCYLIDGDL
jgi:hypothetical protein